MPSWVPGNLTSHHQKRISKDKGCFEDLLGIRGRDMSEAEYEARSQATFVNSWAEYEGEGRDVRNSAYFPRSAYFVDDDLVVAITDLPRQTFSTCYHEHFSSRHGVDPPAGATIGQRRLRYIQNLNREEVGGMIRKLRRIRNV